MQKNYFRRSQRKKKGLMEVLRWYLYHCCLNVAKMQTKKFSLSKRSFESEGLTDAKTLQLIKRCVWWGVWQWSGSDGEIGFTVVGGFDSEVESSSVWGADTFDSPQLTAVASGSFEDYNFFIQHGKNWKTRKHALAFVL